MNPTRWARTRYGPGGSVSSSKRPARSLTANALVAPRADTIAPDTGAPRSSSTLPRMAPDAADAMCDTGRGGSTAVCAVATDARQRSTTTPTAADELVVLLIELLSLSLGCSAKALAERLLLTTYDALTEKFTSLVSV